MNIKKLICAILLVLFMLNIFASCQVHTSNVVSRESSKEYFQLIEDSFKQKKEIEVRSETSDNEQQFSHYLYFEYDEVPVCVTLLHKYDKEYVTIKIDNRDCLTSEREFAVLSAMTTVFSDRSFSESKLQEAFDFVNNNGGIKELDFWGNYYVCYSDNDLFFYGVLKART